MKSHSLLMLCLLVFCITTGTGSIVFSDEVSGELRQWYKVTITFDGPQSGETATPNPFLDYRLNVTFKNGNQNFVVPGYYAADGNAAESSATTGNKWRVHFAPNKVGDWIYEVSFVKGKNIAVSEDKPGQSAGFMDGNSGKFNILPTNKTAPDLRSKGLLQYVGKHHLRFAGTGEYFLKCGADAPENFLAYKDFDGDFKTDGIKDDLIKDWAPHIRDWKPGDPTWQNGKGKGMIGAINYLASEGMNVFSFLPMNIDGDDRNVFPYTTYKERERLDVSKLDQWEIVFSHGTKMGMYLHFKTMETENELLLDKGDLGVQRKLYYRELIARFSHHLALNWNLGEEINNATTAQKVAWAKYFWSHDPYQHNIVIHNMGYPHYDLLGDASELTGFSLQTSKPDFSQVHSRVRNYIDRSAAAGKPWVVACDEPGDATHALITDGEDPAHDNARKNALWGAIMAGGAGIEWYFGYKHPHSDLTCQDYRSRDLMWDQCRVALQFFKKYEIPFWDMKCKDEMTENPDDYILCKDGEIYLVYLKHGGKVTLNAKGGNYEYGWLNPRTGEGLDGLLNKGRIANDSVELTAPDKNDWLIMIEGSGKLDINSKGTPPAPATGAIPDAKGVIVLKAVDNFKIADGNGFVPAYKDNKYKALAVNPASYKDKFAAAEAEFPGKSGKYDVLLLTMAETDGESTYRLYVGDKNIGEFTNPKTSQDYKPVPKTWKDISVKKGDKVRVEFNTATNSGGSAGYSRGRWLSVTFIPEGAMDNLKFARKSAPVKQANFKPIHNMVFEETGGLIAVEAEHFAAQTNDDIRKWHITVPGQTPDVKPDGDDNHAETASGKAYIEILPDTRRTHSDKLINGQNFINEPGKMGVLHYPVKFNTAGRYYVWVRAFSTGSEDNGLHVGIDGTWPDSGQRLQWCEGKNQWQWESRQRTNSQHCGEPYKIYLDIEKPGMHTITFSMREDGFEFDKWIMTQDRNFARPQDEGPAEKQM